MLVLGDFVLACVYVMFYCVPYYNYFVFHLNCLQLTFLIISGGQWFSTSQSKNKTSLEKIKSSSSIYASLHGHL